MDYSEMTNEELEQLVNNYDYDAIHELADRCMYGTKDHEINLKRAYQLYHKGEKQGLSWAYVGLGEMYRNGLRFAKNESVAREYYEKAGVPYPSNHTIIDTSEENSIVDETIPIVEEMDIKNLYNQAMKCREAEQYTQVYSICKEAIDKIEAIESGNVSYNGGTSIKRFKADFNWIKAYTSFNEQKFKEMEYYINQNDVIEFHPWALYLKTISHRINQSDESVLEADLQSLLSIQSDSNLDNQERGDIYVMIADLICEGYGNQSGLSEDVGQNYYKMAADCGNQYALSQLDNK